jgi:hypothetical protein
MQNGVDGEDFAGLVIDQAAKIQQKRLKSNSMRVFLLIYF